MNTRGRVLRCLGLIGIALILAACQSTPSRHRPEAARPGATKAKAQTKAKAKTKTASVPASPSASQSASKSGGGYYKDDGPGEESPVLSNMPDATARDEPLIARANRPYKVFGKTWVPRTRVAPFHQSGIASWYGRRFHGQPTSSGERYNMYAMTAAHPTLPIPSYARVTEIASGRAVVVRINDRGPFLPGRIIDLSYATASKLGYAKRGSAQVEVEQIVPGRTELAETSPWEPAPVLSPAPALSPAAPTAPSDDGDMLGALIADALAVDMARNAPNPGTGSDADTDTGTNTNTDADRQTLFLQLGVFGSRENAEDFRAQAEAQVTGLTGKLDLKPEGDHFRLYAGPYTSPTEARAEAERIGKQLGIQPFIVRRQDSRRGGF